MRESRRCRVWIFMEISLYISEIFCIPRQISFPPNLPSEPHDSRGIARIVLAAFKLSSSASGARAEISLAQKCTISSFRPRPRIDRARPQEYTATIIPPSVFSSLRLRKERRDATRDDASVRECLNARGSIRHRRPDAFAAPKSRLGCSGCHVRLQRVPPLSLFLSLSTNTYDVVRSPAG